MACIENIPPVNGDSEMEEGEIVDELDDLSDISSEEEFLLRQRLQVLESYNNVLERKKAKKVRPGQRGKDKFLQQDLSEISATDNEDNYTQITVIRKSNERLIKQKRKKEPVVLPLKKSRDTKKKPHRNKKKVQLKVVADSSEESDDEYRNKRRKLANAVKVHTPKNDTISLRARLKKMFGTQSQHIQENICNNKPVPEPHNATINPITNSEDMEKSDSKVPIENKTVEESLEKQTTLCELIDLCDDDQVMIIENNNMQVQDTVDGVIEISKPLPKKQSSGDSDEDLELLRQHALKTKSTKIKTDKLSLDTKLETENKPTTISEDEDSDTAELRLICLKSALLKKAIEMKQKQKMRKRLSQSIQEDLENDGDKLSKKIETENHTDIESVDMEMGSDGDETLKEISDHCNLIENIEQGTRINDGPSILTKISITKSPQKDEVEEDEDLLRAKLLTSLSKNWPNLVDPNVLEPRPEVQGPEVPISTGKPKITLPDEKPFIIELGESDSEGEHEATKNLTKMHVKLSEQMDFQEKLDLFLKSTRKEVEKQTLPDVVQKPSEPPKAVSKFVAKTVRHLPKSEQIEYKNLVKRMAELEKIKQARQTTMNLNKTFVPIKDTLKPRNVSFETPRNIKINNLEEQIAVSRKKIADESAKMLKLKEEGTKLSQKYKIVATELKNIATAITLNKREQRSVHSRLTKIRQQHQTLIKSSSSNKHSKTNLPIVHLSSTKISSSTKLQKENNPSKEEYKNPQLLKSVKVSVVNDLKDESASNQRLSVQVDVSSNKKVVRMPKSPPKEIIEDHSKHNHQAEARTVRNDEESIGNNKGNEVYRNTNDVDINNKDIDDYKSPLEALQPGIWEVDPNSFLCPYEVGGTCKDPACKYLHPKIPSDQ